MTDMTACNNLAQCDWQWQRHCVNCVTVPLRLNISGTVSAVTIKSTTQCCRLRHTMLVVTHATNWQGGSTNDTVQSATDTVPLVITVV